jgi:hypothetical protein
MHYKCTIVLQSKDKLKVRDIGFALLGRTHIGIELSNFFRLSKLILFTIFK